MLKARHIVIVGDNQDIRTVLKEALMEAGYRVSVAEGGQALIALLGREPVDLAVLDATLFGEQGLSFATYLRRLTIPVVMMSDSPDIMEITEGNEMQLLLKPFLMAELFEAVENALSSSDLW